MLRLPQDRDFIILLTILLMIVGSLFFLTEPVR